MLRRKIIEFVELSLDEVVVLCQILDQIFSMDFRVQSRHAESIFGIKKELLSAVVGTLTKIDAELLN